MNYKGVISSIEGECFRVKINDLDGALTPPLKKAEHVSSELKVGDNVIVAVFSATLMGGIIIGRF